LIVKAGASRAKADFESGLQTSSLSARGGRHRYYLVM
jgi:hypothetical protein